jgi:hypothetical protein
LLVCADDGEQKINRPDAVFFSNPVAVIDEPQMQAGEADSKIDSRIAVAGKASSDGFVRSLDRGRNVDPGAVASQYQSHSLCLGISLHNSPI